MLPGDTALTLMALRKQYGAGHLPLATGVTYINIYSAQAIYRPDPWPVKGANYVLDLLLSNSI